MRYTDYKLYTEKELRHIKGRLESIIGHWAASWLSINNKGRLVLEIDACEHLSSENNGHRSFPWNAATTSDGNWVATTLGNKPADAIIRVLLENTFESSDAGTADYVLAPSLTQIILFDLAESVIGSGSRDAEDAKRSQYDMKDLPEEIWRPGSGVIHAGITISGEKLSIIISPGIARGYLANLALNPRELRPLVKVNDAIGHVMVKLEVAAGTADLSLRELNSITVGDVIKLDAKLDHPVRVLLGKQKICSAFLGARKGNKAVVFLQS